MTDTRAERCWAEIDLEALRHNARVARECAGPQAALLAVVKANAYGHGVAAVAEALRDEAQLFGVANLHEALETRAVVPHPIVILGPALPAERAAIVEHGFIPSVSSFAEAAGIQSRGWRVLRWRSIARSILGWAGWESRKRTRRASFAESQRCRI